MHSKVEALSSFTARPKRSASASMRSSTPRSVASTAALRASPAARARSAASRKPLLRDRHLDQLLLVHLQRAVAAAQRHAPLAVAEHLDLVVARRLDVELDQHVLVVADAGRLHLGEDLAHQPGHGGGVGEDALPLAAAAADRLQAEAPAGVLGDAGARPRPGWSRRARRSRTGRCGRCTRPRAAPRRPPSDRHSPASAGTSRLCCLAQLPQRLAVGILAQQRARRSRR